ncbi:hypothetical protein ACFW04_014144 [Cataglyphis niger]
MQQHLQYLLQQQQQQQQQKRPVETDTAAGTTDKKMVYTFLFFIINLGAGRSCARWYYQRGASQRAEIKKNLRGGFGGQGGRGGWNNRRNWGSRGAKLHFKKSSAPLVIPHGWYGKSPFIIFCLLTIRNIPQSNVCISLLYKRLK